MPLIETESLVLKTYNLAEADRIVLFLTHDHGLVRGVAKGAKRLKSKFGSGLEPYSVVKLSYFQKESVELVAIQNVELLRSYFAFAGNPLFLQKFAFLIDLLTGVTPPHDPSDDLYRMVRASFDAAAAVPDGLDAIALYFELWLLRLGGYMPDWTRCGTCKREIDRGETVGMQANFQLACGDCKQAVSRILTPSVRRLFIDSRRLPPVVFAEGSINDKIEIEDLSGILKRIFSAVLGHEVVEQTAMAER